MSSGEYVYQPILKESSFESAMAELRNRFPDRSIETGYTPFVSKDVCADVASRLRSLGIPLDRFQAGASDFEAYLRRADYAGRYASYYSGNQKEKSFEHFVAHQLLKPDRGSVFIDVASEGSPLPEILNRLAGCTAYAQDIMYPSGVRDGRIGGDACMMPVADEFADAIALTCSLEHFEGDADRRLFLELARVLRPGGRVVVVPLYLFTCAAAQTDPRYSVSVDIEFDEAVPLYCAEGWGNRHGRFYSPETLRSRLVDPLSDRFRFGVLEIGEPFIDNYDDISIYARFALVAQRR